MSRTLRHVLTVFCCALLLHSTGHAQLAGAEQQRLADGLYARELYDLALVEYRKLIAQEPDPANLDLLFYRAGECAARLDKPQLAEAYFLKSVEIGKTSLPAQRSRYRLADKAYRSGNLEQAEQQLQSLREGEVDASIDAPVRYTLAQILELRGRSKEAVTLYKSLLEDYPEGSLSAYAALRVAALSGGSAEEKRAFYQQALKNPPSRDFEIEALWGLAGLEVQAKNYEQAADLYWRLWEEYPDSTRVRGSMIHLAWAQLKVGDYEKALLLSENTSENRKQADGDTWLYLKAVSHQKQDNAEASLAAFEQLLADWPESRFRALAVYEVAGRYAAAGEHEKVLAFADELQQVPGRPAEGLWLLAESYRGAGKGDEAMRIYAKLAGQHSSHERAADALYFRALLLVNEEDPEAAAAGLTEFVRRYPEDPRADAALEQSGDLLVKADKLQAGLDKWLEVLNRNPDSGEALWFKTAMLEIRLEKTEAAKARLQLLLKKDLSESSEAEAYYWLGVLLDRAGENAEAQVALENAVGGKLKAEYQTPARIRLGQSYTRSGALEKALAAFLPLLGGEQEAGLSDALLLWLLPVAEQQEEPTARMKIAQAMTAEGRKAATRELGWYALAEGLQISGKTAEAEKAWQSGLAFDSGSLEAAEARLQFAELLMTEEKFDEAFTLFSEAAGLASTLEQGRIQAQAMLGNGRVRQAEENWGEAAKYFMSVAVLFDDPELSPLALKLAADCFRQNGQATKAAAAEKELSTRYPQP